MKLKSRIKHQLTLLKMYMNEIEPIVMEEEENMMVPENKEVENPPIAETEYRTRHGRVVLKPERYRDTEKAYAVIREIYQKYLASSDSVHGDFFDSEFRASTSILYQDVLKKQPIDAKAAFKKGIKGILDINVWTTVHMKDLMEEEGKLVISNMKNFVEKLKPENTFN